MLILSRDKIIGIAFGNTLKLSPAVWYCERVMYLLNREYLLNSYAYLYFASFVLLDFEHRVDYSELFQFSLCIFELHSPGIILSYFYFYCSILNNLVIYIYFICLLFQSHDKRQKTKPAFHFHYPFLPSSLLSPLTSLSPPLLLRNIKTFHPPLPRSRSTFENRLFSSLPRKNTPSKGSHKSKARRQPKFQFQLAPRNRRRNGRGKRRDGSFQNFREDTSKSWARFSSPCRIPSFNWSQLRHSYEINSWGSLLLARRGGGGIRNVAGGRSDIDSWQSENIIPRLMSRLRSVFRWGKEEGSIGWKRWTRRSDTDSMKIAIKRMKRVGSSFRSIICSWHFEPMFGYAIRPPLPPPPLRVVEIALPLKEGGGINDFDLNTSILLFAPWNWIRRLFFAVVTFTEGKVTRVPPKMVVFDDMLSEWIIFFFFSTARR